MFDARIVETRASNFFWGFLRLCSIVNFTMFVGRELRFGWAIVAKYCKDYFNVTFYWEAAGAVYVRGCIIPFQFNSWKISFPILWNFVVFLEDLAEVVGMFPPQILFFQNHQL